MATIRLNCIPGDDEIVERALKALTSDAVGDRQHWIGVAGGPGAGKSTFVGQLVRFLNKKCGEGTAIGIGMDGFHYSRAQLSKIAEESDGKYTFEFLIRRRGSPWTFDVKYLIAKLQLLRSEREGSCPVYSRQLSDPVEGGIALRKTNRIVIVEGNYLFNFVDPDWAPLRELFDDRWFLSCESMAAQRQRLVRRHLGDVDGGEDSNVGRDWRGGSRPES